MSKNRQLQIHFHSTSIFDNYTSHYDRFWQKFYDKTFSSKPYKDFQHIILHRL